MAMQHVRTLSGSRLVAALTGMMGFQPPPSGLSLNFASALPFPDETFNMIMQNYYFQALVVSLARSQHLPRPEPHEIFTFNSTQELRSDVDAFPVWLGPGPVDCLVAGQQRSVVPVFSDFILFPPLYAGPESLPKPIPFSRAADVLAEPSSPATGIFINPEPQQLNLDS